MKHLLAIIMASLFWSCSHTIVHKDKLKAETSSVSSVEDASISKVDSTHFAHSERIETTHYGDTLKGSVSLEDGENQELESGGLKIYASVSNDHRGNPKGHLKGVAKPRSKTSYLIESSAGSTITTDSTSNKKLAVEETYVEALTKQVEKKSLGYPYGYGSSLLWYSLFYTTTLNHLFHGKFQYGAGKSIHRDGRIHYPGTVARLLRTTSRERQGRALLLCKRRPQVAQEPSRLWGARYLCAAYESGRRDPQAMGQTPKAKRFQSYRAETTMANSERVSCWEKQYACRENGTGFRHQDKPRKFSPRQSNFKSVLQIRHSHKARSAEIHRPPVYAGASRCSTRVLWC